MDEIYFSFDFDTNYFENDNYFEDFNDFLIRQKLDNDIKETYYDMKTSYINKRMLSISVKVPLKKVLEFSELYKSTNKFNI